LLIEEIGILLYENKVDRHNVYSALTNACQSGQIKYEGDIDSGRVDYDKWASSYRKQQFPDKHYDLLDYDEKERIDKACLDAYWRIVDREFVDVYEVFSPPLCKIHRDELAAYLKSIDFWPLTDCLLANWWDGLSQKSEPIVDDEKLTKRQKQQNAIREVIRMKGFDPMMIPDGEKGTIEKLCRADYPLLFDGVTSFDNAWKDSRDLFKMANHESYAKGGNR